MLTTTVFSATTRTAFLGALIGLALLVNAAPAYAGSVSQPKGWGVGLMLGSPTGLNAKQWLGGANAWDIGLGTGPGLRVHVDYLWGLAQVLSDTSDLTLDLYIGLGPVVGISRGWCGGSFGPHDRCDNGSAFVGARVPLGIDARLRDAPVEFGLEIAPGLVLQAPSAFISGMLDAFVFVRFLL
jgi:hypothetical protein